MRKTPVECKCKSCECGIRTYNDSSICQACEAEHHMSGAKRHNLLDSVPQETAKKHNYRLSLGLTMVSSAFPINTNARPVTAIMSPGGMTHHQRPRAAAPCMLAS